MYLVTYRVCKSNQENGIEVSKSFRFFFFFFGSNRVIYTQ